MDASFSKNERLCNAKDFNFLFSKGKSLFHFPVKAQYVFVASTTPEIKVAFAVPAKKIKKAVHRNYIKRVFREIYRKNKQPLYDVIDKYTIFITFIYVSDEKLSYHQIEPTLLLLLQQIKEEYIKNAK